MFLFGIVLIAACAALHFYAKRKGTTAVAVVKAAASGVAALVRRK